MTDLYEVRINRTRYSTHTIMVAADNPAEAKSIAYDCALEEDTNTWSHDWGDIEIEHPVLVSQDLQLKITARQRDTILAALRTWQYHLAMGLNCPIGPSQFRDLQEIATNDRAGMSALTVEEINELCEEINA